MMNILSRHRREATGLNGDSPRFTDDVHCSYDGSPGYRCRGEDRPHPRKGLTLCYVSVYILTMQAPSPRKMRAPERRASILEAAFGAFAAHGYLGTSTRELARAAGVTEVTLFRHFPTKELLFREAVSEMSPLARASPLPLEGDEPRAALLAAGLALFRLLGENRGVLRIMMGEAGRHPEVGAAIFAEVEMVLIHPLEQAIARWQETRALRPGSPALLARAFLGMFFYFFLTESILRRREISTARRSRAVREFVSLFLEGKKP